MLAATFPNCENAGNLPQLCCQHSSRSPYVSEVYALDKSSGLQGDDSIIIRQCSTSYLVLIIWMVKFLYYPLLSPCILKVMKEKC